MPDAIKGELKQIGREIAATRKKLEALSQQKPVPQGELKQLEAELTELTERYYRLNPKPEF